MAGAITRRALVLAAPALCLSERFASAEPAPVRLALIVAKTSPLRDLSLTQLQEIYKGKQRTVAGQTVLPFNHPAGTQDRVGFDRVVLGLEPEEVARYWIDQKIRGGNPPPRTTDSMSLLVRLVIRLSGAVGYVRAGFITPELTALMIDGREWTDPAYPIQYVPRPA